MDQWENPMVLFSLVDHPVATTSLCMCVSLNSVVDIHVPENKYVQHTIELLGAIHISHCYCTMKGKRES
jgi:hypothetical protein